MENLTFSETVMLFTIGLGLVYALYASMKAKEAHAQEVASLKREIFRTQRYAQWLERHLKIAGPGGVESARKISADEWSKVTARETGFVNLRLPKMEPVTSVYEYDDLLEQYRSSVQS